MIGVMINENMLNKETCHFEQNQIKLFFYHTTKEFAVLEKRMISNDSLYEDQALIASRLG